MADVILFETSARFLGLSTNDLTLGELMRPAIGIMTLPIKGSFQEIMLMFVLDRRLWGTVTLPGTVIVLIILAFYLCGDALKDKLNT